MKVRKCQFALTQIQYLGHEVSADGVRPSDHNIKKIAEFAAPQTLTGIRGFISLCSYYRKFIENFSKIAEPLTEMTRKGEEINWTERRLEAFETLKKKLIEKPLLHLINYQNDIILSTDASSYALGAVLAMRLADGREVPVAYASRTLNKTERNYATTMKEFLAVRWAVEYFRHYLYGRKFEIITDHQPLIGLLTTV